MQWVERDLRARCQLNAALPPHICAFGECSLIAFGEDDPLQLAAPRCLRAGVLLAQASQRKSGKE